MKEYRNRKRRVLGQHFLASPGVLRRIVEVIDPQPDTFVVEIGPGKGVLTFPLAEKAGKLVAVEKDPAMVPFLREKALPGLTVIEGDTLDLDFVMLIDEVDCAISYGKRADLAPIFDQLHPHALPDCRVWLFCLNTDLFQHNTSRLWSTLKRVRFHIEI